MWLEEMSHNPINPAVLFRPPPPVQFLLLGTMDDMPLPSPVDDYMMVQVIEDTWSFDPSMLMLLAAVQDDPTAAISGAGGGEFLLTLGVGA